ncbi:phage tail protein [Lysinibacillus sp.]|uniref:phage tail protein n=1 Tax=Lysinibacillus sp. TaxID=1869345 RepID=UPI0028A67DDF|nr:phage tail protein [Lysinibacillus sp.]
MIDLKQNTLLREIPNNLLQDEKVKNLAKTLQTSLDQMRDWAYKINYTLHLDKLDDAVLDHLLWEKHIGWNEGLSLATTRQQKINLIQTAINTHRRKGTPAAIEQALEALNLPGDVIEWFQYEGEPFHFKVEVTTTNITSKTLFLLRQLVNEYKNTRSWLDFVAVKLPKNEYIEIESSKSHYPVYLPVCGEIYCEGVPGAGTKKSIEIESKNYTYPVYMPICGEIFASEVIDTW